VPNGEGSQLEIDHVLALKMSRQSIQKTVIGCF